MEVVAKPPFSLYYNNMNIKKDNTISHKMKVIFLDIDGVLNDEETYRAALENPDKDILDTADDPTDEHLKQLKEIVGRTDAKIVLSSAWRCSVKGVQVVLESLAGYDMHLFSVTDNEVNIEDLKRIGINVIPRSTHNRYYYSDGPAEVLTSDRGAEIAMWLHKHNVESFVILDDEVNDIISYFPNNVVTTNFNTGLTWEDVDKAIQILNF